MRRITAEFETLMEQAPMTTDVYLRKAIRSIDEAFNTTGYARTHPELVAAYLHACAIDYQTSCLTGALQEIGDEITSAVEYMVSA